MAFLLAAPPTATPPTESKLRGVRTIQGFDKNEFGKVILVGPGSRACHVLLHSIFLTGFWHQGVTAVQLE